MIQLVWLDNEDLSMIAKWLDKAQRKHVSHVNQNEILEIMAHELSNHVLADIQTLPLIAIMVDETTNVSSVEQLTMVIRFQRL